MKTVGRNRWLFYLIVLILVVFQAACSARTPYSLDIAKESSHYSGMTKAQAVDIIESKARVSGEYADYRSFIVDDKGFSYIKTTKKKKTEWQGKKSVQKEYTNTLTRNVPWSAVRQILPFFQHNDVFGDDYIAWLSFKVTKVEYSSRREVNADFELKAKSYEDLTDIVAALKVLTGV